MKGYKDFIPALPPVVDDEDFQPVPAKMLGSAIVDGRYNGVSDGEAGLLHNQYDDNFSDGVDPLCDLNTDPFGMRNGSSPVPSASITEE